MKKSFKILTILSLVLCFSFKAFALFGGGGGASTAVLLKILAVETASKSEHVRNTLEAIKQTENLANQLKYEIQNAQQLGKDIGAGNEYAIQKLVHSALNFQEESQSIMYEQEQMMGKLQNIFKTSENLKGLTVDELRLEARKIREQQQYAVYDAMRNAGFSATLKQDQQNLQKLVSSANSSQGQLQALQAISNLLGEQNAILLKIGTLLETQTKMNTMAQGASNSIEQTAEQTKDEIDNESEKEADKILENIKKSSSKKSKII